MLPACNFAFLMLCLFICMCILLMLQLLSYFICHALCIYMFLNVCVVTVFHVGKKLYRAYVCNVTRLKIKFSILFYIL